MIDFALPAGHLAYRVWKTLLLLLLLLIIIIIHTALPVILLSPLLLALTQLFVCKLLPLPADALLRIRERESQPASVLGVNIKYLYAFRKVCFLYLSFQLFFIMTGVEDGPNVRRERKSKELHSQNR
jgi:hypothetical protein